MTPTAKPQKHYVKHQKYEPESPMYKTVPSSVHFYVDSDWFAPDIWMESWFRLSTKYVRSQLVSPTPWHVTKSVLNLYLEYAGLRKTVFLNNMLKYEV